MAETKENVKNELPDNTSTNNIMSHDDEKAVIIDIPVELEPDMNNTCWIHRVPRKLRKVNEAAYTPQLVSIGPFHHGKPELMSMEVHKTEYQKKFWERDFCNHLDVNKVIERFMKQDGRIGRIRSCYAGTFGHLADDDAFSKVILKDACFIFELFLRKGEANNDYILRTPWLRNSIVLDLMLLENQLPFFVFTELFEFILDEEPHIMPNGEILPTRPSKLQACVFLLVRAIKFFKYYFRIGTAFDDEEMKLLCRPAEMTSGQILNSLIEQWVDQEKGRLEEIKHFTDLFRQFMCPKKESGQAQPQNKNFTDLFSQSLCPKKDTSCKKSTTSNGSESGDVGQDQAQPPTKHFTDLFTQCLCSKESKNSLSISHSAKTLDRAGVKFVACRNNYLANVVCIVDTKYKCLPCMSLKVEIPKLVVEHTTECVLRNVMALEQCVYPRETRICDYIYLLDQLINTAEDVELLVEKSIIENLLGSNDEVAIMFNKLCEQIVGGKFLYGDLCDRLNKHYNNCCSSSKETFKRVYCKDCWTGSSTVFGVILGLYSLFTVVSTIVDLTSGQKK